MKATARRDSGYRHTVKIRSHELAVDERADVGGTDTGPEPLELLAAALASCTAVTMEMYAQRKGWDVAGVEVTCDYTPAERGCPTRFNLLMRFPDELARHKALDLLGDLALVGGRLRACVVAIKAGHSLHVAAASKIRRLAYDAEQPGDQ